ncbi:hypothetical protein [Sorangium sp. So ce117]|uniref:hypothetical protein n=1 Tax=Sorangium sp. So ce117 TaxID=3133277 RepID=UPI003F5F8FF1
MVAAMLVRSALSWVPRGPRRDARRLTGPALGRRAPALLGAALALSLGCSGAAPAPVARQAPVVKTPPAQPKAPEGPPLLPARVIAELDDEDATPYFARRGDEALLLHAAGGRFRTRILGADGAPRGDTVDAGPVAADVPVAALRATPQGYIAAWIEQIEGSRAVRVLALDPAGKPSAPASLVAQTAEEISWLDVLPNAQGALVLWEMPREAQGDAARAGVAHPGVDRVDVVMTVVAQGKGAAIKPTAPASVAREVLGWHAVATERGAAVALVLPPAAPRGRGEGKPARKAEAEDAAEDGKLGSVALLEIDAAGKVSAPVVVSPEPTAQIDLEIASLGGRYLLTWTDERDIDGAVYLAAVEPGGKVVVAPRQATPPSGEQALVSLVAPSQGGGGRALLAWEDLLRARGGEVGGAGARGPGRLIHLASVGPDGTLGAERAGLVFSASGPPDIAADGDGFAAVTLAPATLKMARDGAAAPPVWPTFVRFGPDLSVRAAEPVRAAPFAATDGVPYLVRGLTCHAGACATLASAAPGPQPGGAAGAAGARAPLALVSLPVRESAWRAPAFREDKDPPPRATAVRALAEGDSIAEVAAVELDGGAALSAWVTYFVEGASDAAPRGQEVSATLAVRAVSPGGLGKLSVLSQKASSLGGVAIAAAPPLPADAKGKGATQGESVIAWVARERGETQVYLTKVDATGAKVAQKKLTTAPRKKQGGAASEASDVAIAYDGAGGFIVAWIDTRDGNAEVYAARVDRALNRTAPDRRITNAPLDAAEVQIAVRGQEVWLVWSDARTAGGAAAGGVAAGGAAAGGAAAGGAAAGGAAAQAGAAPGGGAAAGGAAGQGDEPGGDIFLARLDAKTLQRIGDESRLHASSEHSRSPVLAPLEGGLFVGWIDEPADESGGGAGAGGRARLVRVDGNGAVQGPPVVVSGPDGAAVSSLALACDKICRGVLASAPGDSVELNAFTLAPGDVSAPSLKPLAWLTGGASQDVSPAFAGRSGASLFFADDAVSGSGRVRWMTIAWP